MENHRVGRSDRWNGEGKEDNSSDCELNWNESYPIQCTGASVGFDN